MKQTTIADYQFITADGRYIAFASDATNLMPDDNGDYQDIFLHDRQTAITTRISTGGNGEVANDRSFLPSISSDGRYIVFGSFANNLVPNDTNNNGDVFVYDRQTGVTNRVSVDSNGNQSNEFSGYSSVSATGRYITFYSEASNLVPDDTNGLGDTFIHDQQTGTTTRIVANNSQYVFANYGYIPTVSADGRYVAFASDATDLIPDDTNNAPDIFVYDFQTDTTSRVSIDGSENQSNGLSSYPVISANGHYIMFYSDATNFVPNDTNGKDDVFIRDLQLGTTTRVSVDSNGVQSNGDNFAWSISADGRFISFDSDSSNLVAGDTNLRYDVFLHDLQTAQTMRVSIKNNLPNNLSAAPHISADGRYIAFDSFASNLITGDTNNQRDVFVHDRQTGLNTRVNLDGSGNQAVGGDSQALDISDDGRYTVFRSGAPNLVTGDTNNVSDIFIHDRDTGSTVRVNVDSSGNQALGGGSSGSSISADGRFVVFASAATNLVSDDMNGQHDIFVRDRDTDIDGVFDEVGAVSTTRISISSGGIEGNGMSGSPSIGADGRYIVFDSDSSNLVPDDTNNASDIFVHDRQTNITSRISLSSLGVQGNSHSVWTNISGTGRYITFTSDASNLVANDTNGMRDIFLFDRDMGSTVRVSVDSSGAQADNFSFFADISADGNLIVFQSFAENLVAGDTNLREDIFVHNLQTGSTERISVTTMGAQVDGENQFPTISPDGQYIAFMSDGAFDPADTNAAFDIFVSQFESESEPTPTFTAIPPTETSTTLPPTNTFTPVPPTVTSTLIPPTNTFTPEPVTVTETPLPPTATVTTEPATSTYTAVPPTMTFTSEPATATYTVVPPTVTATIIPPTLTSTSLPATATNTIIPPTMTSTSEPATVTSTPESQGTELLVDGGFEIDILPPLKQPDNWTVTLKSQDKLKCNTDTAVVAFEGLCAYFFKGSVTEATKLVQKPDLSAQTFTAGNTLTLSVQFKTIGAAPKLKFKLIVIYSDTSVERGKVKGTISTVSADVYSLYSANPYVLTSGGITTIKVQFQNRSLSGKLYIDDASLILSE